MTEITGYHIRVLRILWHDNHSGRFIRSRITEDGVKESLAAFYWIMERMEDADLVSGWYETENVQGNAIITRWYRATIKGLLALKENTRCQN